MRSIAVIGAGPAGLVSAKSLREEGLSATVFDSADQIGGLWNPNRGPTWEGMRTNLSRHSCAFSDLPHQAGTRDFLDVQAMAGYLRSYADTFALHPHVRLQQRVHGVRLLDSGCEVLVSSPDGQAHRQLFDGAVVCSGVFSRGHIPAVEGLQNFRGTVLHSADYRSRERYRGKRVVVIANGLSGVEIAADVAEVAASVQHVTRRPNWILPRYLDTAEGRLPLDLVMYRRTAGALAHSALEAEPTPQHAPGPLRRRNAYLAGFSLQNRSRDQQLHIDPQSADYVPTAISDSYLEHVDSGAITLHRSAPAQGRSGGIVLENGSQLLCDVLIFATGYRYELPFLSDSIRAAIGYQGDDPLQPALLFQATFRREMPTIAFVGGYKGPFFGIMELQARVAAALLAETLPKVDDEIYARSLRNEEAIRDLRPRLQFPHADYVAFADRLAELRGCRPTLPPSDPLHAAVDRGPVIPAHFRLSGPHANPTSAREQITDLNTTMFARR